MARAELSALSLDMTQVKVNNIQKYKSGTIKFVPKDVFVLHGRKKANVADQSINNDLWFNLPNRVWGNIAATYEIANRDDYYSGTNASSSFGRFAGGNKRRVSGGGRHAADREHGRAGYNQAHGGAIGG